MRIFVRVSMLLAGVLALVANPQSLRAQSADVATTLNQAPVSPATVAPGASITYTLTLTNAGPNLAQAVVGRVQLPVGLTAAAFTSPSFGSAYNNATGLLTLSAIDVAAGSATSFSFSILAPNYSATVGAVASSTATTADPNAANNDGSAAAARTSTTVVLPTNGCAGTGYGPAAPASSGLYADYYNGYFADNLSFFAGTAPVLSRYDAQVNFAANNAWGNLGLNGGGNGTANSYQQYSARYRGSVNIPATGTYTLSLTSDDASYLWLDGAAVVSSPTLASVTINNGGAHGAQTVSAPVTLSAGLHDVLIYYGQAGGDNTLSFSYAGGPGNLPTQVVPNAALCATQILPSPQADVVTTLNVSATTVQPGTALTYTVTVLNNGPTDASNVAPRLQLPVGLAAGGLTLPAGATYSNATGLVTLPTIGTLGVGAAAQQSFAVSFAAPPYSATLTGVASSTATTPADPNAANNDGSAAAARTSTTVLLPTNGCAGTGYGPAAPASSGLYADYYNGYFADNLSFFAGNTPVLSRYDAQVNFAANNAWGNLGLNGGGNGTANSYQQYSARYRGSVNIPATGTYTLSLNSDDASYLWLDGAAVAASPTLASATINNGGAHGAQTVSATVTLSAGLHNVLIYYGQAGGDNVLTFSYAGGPGNLATQPVPNAALCATQVPPPQADVATTLSRTSAATSAPGAPVSHTLTVANAGPTAALSVSVRVQLPAGLASSTFTLPAGATYTNATGLLTFPTLASLEASGAGSSVSYNFSFTAPNYSATLPAVASSTSTTPDPNAANNDGSAAAAQASTTVVLPANSCAGTAYGPSVSSGLYAEYYAGNFSDALGFFASNTPALARYDAQLNFPADNSWGNLSPAATTTPADQPQQYSARYRGSINIPATGTYTLSLTSDDGSYLWLDGAALAATPTLASATINNGGAHSAQTVSATVTLSAGPHNVLIFYGQGVGSNVLAFSYAGGPGNLPTQLVPNSALCATQVTLPLPVRLTAFTAAAAGPAAELAWTTASELSSAYFGVERSLDGSRYEELGRVAAQGNKVSATSYAFRDAGLGALPAGQPVYYRLRQVDLDGTLAYSPVRSLVPTGPRETAPAPLLRCYPVPATATGTTLDLRDLPKLACEVTLLDLAGRTLRRWQFVGGQTQALALPGLPAGLYQLLISGTTTDGRAFRQALRLPKE